MSLSMFHNKRLILMLAGTASALLVGALIVFEPWLLFIDKTVNDALPRTAVASPSASAQSGTSSDAAGTPHKGPVVVTEGSFISHEHETKGTARIYRLSDGRYQLALADLETSNGPDVHVWLSAGPVIEGTSGWHTAADHEHLDVSPIKGNLGNQLYDLPKGIDLSNWKSVFLWCKEFSVSFGAAELKPAA